MGFPWKRHRPTEPNSGCEGLSIGLPRLMSLRRRSENKQRAPGEVGEDGMSVREGILALEEYLVRDDGMAGGGTTGRTSGISVRHGFVLWMEDTGGRVRTSALFPLGDYCASKDKWPHGPPFIPGTSHPDLL